MLWEEYFYSNMPYVSSSHTHLWHYIKPICSFSFSDVNVLSEKFDLYMQSIYLPFSQEFMGILILCHELIFCVEECNVWAPETEKHISQGA